MNVHHDAGHADSCSGFSVEDHHEQGRIKCGLKEVEDKDIPTSHVQFL